MARRILVQEFLIFRTKHDQTKLENTGLCGDVNGAHSFCHFGKLGRSPLDHNLAGINQRHTPLYEGTDDPATSGVSHLNSERQGTPACSM